MSRTPTTPTGRLYLSLAEASEVTGMSVAYLRRAVARGALTAKRTGPNGTGQYLVTQRDLDAWFDGLDPA